MISQEKKLMADIKKSAKAGQMVSLTGSLDIHFSMNAKPAYSLRPKFKQRILSARDVIYRNSRR